MSQKIEVEISGQYHAFLGRHLLAILTTMRPDGILSTNPIGYVRDGRHIRFSALKSRMKYKIKLRDDRVCFCVQSPFNPMDNLEIRGHTKVKGDPDRSFF